MPDVSRFTLQLRTAEETSAQDPDCNVSFKRTDSSTAVVAKDLVFPPDHTIVLPAFPQEQNLFCLIEPTLYQAVQSQFFRPIGDTSQQVTVLRLPDKWSPVFVPFGQLPAPRFDPFRAVAVKSPNVDVKHGPKLGKLDAAFDNLAGTQQILAKMALLNLYAVLSDETNPVDGRHWFPFVEQIVRMDQERFVAETDPQLFAIVQTILDDLDHFDGFFTELSPNLHLDNIPSSYKLTADLITVKKRYEQGNVQFTMGQATSADGRSVVLLDCDMDEHSNIIEHTGDLFTHIFTGGTHPIDMHEYIVHHDHNVQLGYTLQPASAAIAATAVVRG